MCVNFSIFQFFNYKQKRKRIYQSPIYINGIQFNQLIFTQSFPIQKIAAFSSTEQEKQFTIVILGQDSITYIHLYILMEEVKTGDEINSWRLKEEK